jgi:hypothetical protein
MECAEARVRSYMLPIERPKNSVASFSLDDFAASALEKPPTAGEADCAQRALELYLQFSQTLDTNEVKSDSRWVRLGVEALISASHHLQRFWRASETQETLADTAAGLRASARSVAKWLASLPSERKTFCFGDRILTSDDVMRDFSDNLNIFRCELNWGSFWQERPEDTLALYRELMTHPRYPCIHQDLWFRLNARPRLVSWNRATAALQPALWDSFIHDLNASTNAYIVMEAKALALADAVSSRGVNDNRTLDAGVAFFDYVIGNYDSIIAANEQLLYLNWQLDRFGARWGFYGTGIGTGHKYRWDVVWGFYLSANTNAPGGQVSQEDQYNYAPRLLALRDDYTKRNSEKIKELATAEMFEEQKAFLAASRPYDFIKFTDLFNKRDCYHKQMDYSQAQAAQLLPLIQAYKSNIIARAAGGSQQEKFKAAHNAGWVGAMLEYRVREILNAPTAVPPVRAFQSKGVPPESTEPQKPDNILLVTDFHPLPKDSLAANDFAGTFDHSWNEGRLLLGLQHNSSQNPAVAIFDPQHDNWAIVKYTNRPDAAQPPEYLPNIVTSTLRVEAMDRFGPGGAPFALLDDHLYLSVNGRFNQYDFHTRQWTALNLPGIQHARLFVVNQRLYAANSESIFEITRQGRTARLLAGTRRRPAQSLLDTMDKFKDPVLFAGPNQSLRAALDDNWVYSWNGSDWHKEFSAIGTANPAGEGMFFRSERGVWLLGDNGAAPQWCFDNQWRTKNYFRWSPGANARAKPKQRMFDSGGSRELASETPTLWVCPFEEFLTYLPGTAYQSNLYFLVDHSPWAARDGYDVKLVCLLRGDGNPKFVPLKFASSAGASFSLPPASGSLQDTWLQFVGDRLIISLGGSPGVWTIPVANLPSNPPDDRGT